MTNSRRELLTSRGYQIGPSILKVDYGRLEDEVERLTTGGANMLHWDVMDGHFVPNLSYGAMVLKSLRSRTDLYFDAHLMISDPAKYLDDFVKAGCDAITIHIEAVPQPAELLKAIRAQGCHAGLALNPATTAEAVLPFAHLCDLILVMSVNPGFGGQSFIPNVLPKAKLLREKLSASTRLSIDGGIAPGTIEQAAAAGIDLFVAGSAIFDLPDYGQAIADLTRRAVAAAPLGSPFLL